MNPQPGDVLEYESASNIKLMVVILKRYPTAWTNNEEVEVLWLMGHGAGTSHVTTHRAHPDTWEDWVKVCGSV